MTDPADQNPTTGVLPALSPESDRVSPSPRPSLDQPRHSCEQQPQQHQPLEHSQPQQPQHSPSPFSPIFTLVTDTSTRVTHHPHVHYIFADDDPDVLTAALERHQYPRSPELDVGTSKSELVAGAGSGGRQCAVVLDLAPRSDGSGYDVTWASSLSGDWAVVSAKLTGMDGEPVAAAPVAMVTSNPNAASSVDGGATGFARPGTSNTIVGPAAGDRDKDGHGIGPGQQQQLMLRIQVLGMDAAGGPFGGGGGGGDGTPPTVRSQELLSLQQSSSGGSSGPIAGGGNVKKQQIVPDVEDYGSLMDDFDRRMVLLRQVVDSSEHRRQMVQLATDPTGLEAPLLPDDEAVEGEKQQEVDRYLDHEHGAAPTSATLSADQAPLGTGD